MNASAISASIRLFHEPLSRTLLRTVTLACVVGAIVALVSRHWSIWPLATLLALWPSFGGHWVELAYLNWMRPLVAAPGLQRVVRIITWFAGGALLALGMRLTAAIVDPGRSPRWLTWAIGGAAFVGIELLIHLLIHLRGKPSFYDGRG